LTELIMDSIISTERVIIVGIITIYDV